MVSARIRFIYITVALCFLAFWGHSAHAVVVETQTNYMTPGGTCEQSGKIKLTFDQNDIFLIQEHLFTSSDKYLAITIYLYGEGGTSLFPMICQNLHGTAAANDAGGSPLPFSGELIPLDEMGVEVSSYHSVSVPIPDITAYLHGDSGATYVEILITGVQSFIATENPWIEIGLTNEVSADPTAIWANVNNFTENDLLKASISSFNNTQLTFTGDDEIGHFKVEGAIPAGEREALIALYNATEGANWTQNGNWLGNAGTECEWFGIECNEGHVSGITLSDNNLKGSIPEEIGQLEDLEKLYLNTNQLSGNLPSAIGSIAGLKELELSENTLSGSIPDTLGSLSSLTLLSLWQNEFTGTIPESLAGLVNLETLYLGINRLTGEIPEALGSLGSLKRLHLLDNQLSGSIPPALGNPDNLEELHLGNNALTGSIPGELGSLSQLKALQLYENQLTGSIPAALGSLGQLNELSLYSNGLTGEIPPEIANLDDLKYLYLGNNEFSGSIPKELGNLAMLKYLALYGNKLTGEIPPEIGQLAHLEYLKLGSNQLSGSLPESLGSLGALKEFHADYNELSGSLPDQLGNLAMLESLYLRYNRFTGALPDALGNLTALRELVLHNNHLEGQIPASLGSLTALEYLYLDSNLFSGPVPSEITQLTALKDGENEFRWNALYTDDPAVKNFLDAKQSEGDWESTQTVAPEELSAAFSSDTSVTLSWTPITYTDGETGSGYEIYYAAAEAGPFELYSMTSDKLKNSADITGLDAGTTYYFRLRTKTVHFYNTIFSEFSATVSAGMEFPAEELAALNDLYTSTGGNQWTNNTGWLSNEIPPCSWFGVVCESNHVVELNLNANNLSGPLPASMTSFSQLKILRLGNNQLTGDVLKQVSALTGLQVLDLSATRLAGVIPQEIGNLVNLEELNLADNQLAGPVPEALKPLSSLADAKSDFRNNRLFLDPPSADFNEFLRQKQIGGDWLGFQTHPLTTVIPSGSEEKDFSMLSFPIKPSDPSAEAFLGIIYNTADYRIGTYDPLTGEYTEYDRGLTIQPGTAYWFFSRNGDNLALEGGAVSPYEDYDITLLYNADTDDGWNMIAPPSNRRFNWNLIRVVIESEDRKIIPVSSPEAGDYISNRRIWSWKDGDYVYYQPDGPSEETEFDFDASLQLEAQQGVWVKALQSNISLRFPGNAEYIDNPEIREEALAASMLKKGMALAGNALPAPASAIADSGESPPAPISGFTSDGESRTDSGGGGCFIKVVSGR